MGTVDTRNALLLHPAQPIRRAMLVTMSVWVILVVSSYFWNRVQIHDTVQGLALEQARSHFEKDVLIRRWAAMHGGVYVPPSTRTPPNPYLAHLPDRDVVTDRGKSLTLINPAYMTRQLHELAAQKAGVLGHITSLKPLRPENIADAWEGRALRDFERGIGESSELVRMGDKDYLRFMRPLFTEPPCLKCHAGQGYKVGDVRGGISVAVPFAPYQAMAAMNLRTMGYAHLGIALLGLFGIGLAGRRLQRAESSLHASLLETDRLENREVLLTSLSEGVFGIDRQGRCTFINAAALQMLGYTEDEVLGQAVHPLLHHHHQDGSAYPFEDCPTYQALREGKRFDGEDVLFRKDGEQLQVQISGNPMRDGAQVVGEVVAFHDITRRKQIEAELEAHRHHLEDMVTQRTAELDGLFHALPDLYFRMDHAGVILDYRAGRSAALYVPPERFLNQRMQDVLPAEVGARFAAAIEAVSRGEPLVVIEYELSLQGDSRNFEARLLPLDDAQIIAVVRDISERKAMESAREQALQEAQQLARVKSEFLANMSHEIRTPLNGVLGFAHIGLRASDGRDKVRDAFTRIIDSGQMLLGIINDILDFSKIDAGRLKIETAPVDVALLLHRATDLIRIRAQEKGLELRTESRLPPHAHYLGDALRLEQILSNLLSNAVKFTDEGHVTLTAAIDGDTLQLRVSDTGIGMSPEQISVIFSPFTQADGSITRKYGGTGLGLTITRRLTELMGGTIRVESTPGVGSQFQIDLPWRPLPETPDEPLRNDAAGTCPLLTGLRLLAAEDDDINQIVLDEILSDTGCHLDLTRNGAEAVARVRDAGAGHYQLVLMDIQMAVMDGYEATRLIHQIDADLPVLGLSASVLQQDLEACKAAGMADHLPKPIDPKALYQAIQRHARKSGTVDPS